MLNYFHIPTRIVQGYESHTNLSDFTEIIKKRVILVTDSNMMNLGVTQNLRCFVENVAYGLIFYEVKDSLGFQEDAISLVKEAKAQTIIGFGDTHVLSVARAMAQFSSTEKHKINYIEIPSLPCIYTGLLEKYYISHNFETLKKPYVDLPSRAEWLILDSSYTEYCRVDTILESSVQSLAYAFDTLFSRESTMLSESYALKAIELIVSSGNRLPNEPTNIKLKNELMLASLLVSFAIQSSSLGICAGIAMSLENSLICSEVQGAGAVLLSALEYSLPSNLDKFQKVARVLNIEEKDSLDSGAKVIETIQNLLVQMEIKPLGSYSSTPNLLELTARQSARYQFMTSLTRPAGYYEITEVIKKASTNGIKVELSASAE